MNSEPEVDFVGYMRKNTRTDSPFSPNAQPDFDNQEAKPQYAAKQ